jgi:glutamate/tyrosine decarboxylase-like PLP-dependent enzyme
MELPPSEFRRLGHRLVDHIADFLDSLPARPVAPTVQPSELRTRVGAGGLPEEGTDPGELVDRAARLLFEASVFNGHPRFMGYITSSAAPIGALADLLASSVNPNCGGYGLSPVATVIEEQTVAWIAELVGAAHGTSGLLVSGGNMANMVGFWAGRAARAGWPMRAGGMAAEGAARMVAYCSAETHTWVQKAADLSGLGTDAVRWIPIDGRQRMKVEELRAQIAADRAAGLQPFLVVGTAGTVATGAVDPLEAIADICAAEGLWFHVDGAYGAPAAVVPGAPADLAAMRRADSIAVDPHKWLYAPLEAGCALVRDAAHLRGAFSYTPDYYHFHEDGAETPPPNYYEYGLQNSRGFRALKVWLGLQQVGRRGYARMIEEDIRLSRELYALAGAHPEIEAVTQALSIATFRYVPPGVDRTSPAHLETLNRLNERVLERVQSGGTAFVSNAMLDGRFLLRACIVNFRTDASDLHQVVNAVVEAGRAVSGQR